MNGSKGWAPAKERPLRTLRGEVAAAGRTAVMGIVNVTPDSFADGGRYLDPAAAIAGGTLLAEQGADIIDVGGESTRPGASPVSAREEMDRVLPVIRGLRRAVSIPISIDTYKAEVADAALAAGADVVNDISALRFDPAMAPLVARAGVPVVLMHMQGTPRTMQESARYENVVEEVKEFLAGRIRFALEAGVERSRIIIDPGIGFGKGLEHNLALLSALPALASLGRPILVGASRKSFVGRLLGVGPEGRLEGSLAAAVAAALAGAKIIRTHDVDETRRALRIADALRYGVSGSQGAKGV